MCLGPATDYEPESSQTDEAYSGVTEIKKWMKFDWSILRK